MDLIAHNLAPIMFGGLLVFLLIGFPVAFSLGACGLFFAVIGINLGVLPPALLQALPLRIFGIMQNDTLLAVPFFTLMGLVLERSGMAEDLLDTVGQVFGPIRGGLALAVVLVGALLAATTGVVAASVISMGLISLPIMLRYGYDRKLASGVIAASGTLAQIIPPSLVLIIMADQLGRSVSDMYRGAMLPGLMLMACYIVYVVVLAIFRPAAVPALPPEARTYREPNGSGGYTSLLVLSILCVISSWLVASNITTIYSFIQKAPVTSVATDEAVIVSLCISTFLAFVLALLNKLLRLNMLSRLAERVTFVLIPPLLLIFLVLGTIFLGVATPTEGGAMGAIGAIILATVRGRLGLKLLMQALESTTKLAAFVMYILIGATVFSLVFQGVDGAHWVEGLLTSLPGGVIGFLIVVNILVFLLSFFLDYFELSFIIVPLLAPVAHAMGIDLIWFGVLLAVNMQTSFMHPPFGFALFFLRSVAPDKPYTDRVTKKTIQPITSGQIYRGAIPFLFIQLCMVGVLIAFPQIVTSAAQEEKKLDMKTVTQQMNAPLAPPALGGDPFQQPKAASASGAAASGGFAAIDDGFGTNDFVKPAAKPAAKSASAVTTTPSKGAAKSTSQPSSGFDDGLADDPSAAMAKALKQ